MWQPKIGSQSRKVLLQCQSVEFTFAVSQILCHHRVVAMSVAFPPFVVIFVVLPVVAFVPSRLTPFCQCRPQMVLVRYFGAAARKPASFMTVPSICLSMQLEKS
jgi:hypothetical protein